MSEQIPESYEFRVAPQLEGVFAVQEAGGSTVTQTQVAPNSLRRRIGGRVVAAVAATAFVTGGLLASVHGSRDQAHEEDGAYTGSNNKIAAITADPNAQWGSDFKNEVVVDVVAPEFTPASYKPGDFIGALVIDYAEYDKYAELSDSEMEKCRAGEDLEDKMGACFWQLRTEYFGEERTGYTESVRAFTAGGKGVDEYLDNGPVVHQQLEGEPIVIAHHNITETYSSVVVDGQEYSQILNGINNYMADGTMVTLVEETPVDGQVIKHSYRVVGHNVVDFEGRPVEATAAMFGTNDGVDMRMYQCWTPGISQFRLVYDLEKISDEFVEGSVEQVGETIIGDGHLG